MDAKLKRVRVKYGMEGYGLYWYCLELIAQTVEKHNLTFELEHDAELIASDTNIHQERVQEMMSDMVKWGLFENTDGIITCLKMATRTDEYTQKLIKHPDNVPTISRQSPDNVRLNRRDRRERKEESTRTKKTAIPKNFEISDRVRSWAKRHGYGNLDEHLENFKLKSEAKGYRYVNWDTAFMTAIRDNWAGISNDNNEIIYETD